MYEVHTFSKRSLPENQAEDFKPKLLAGIAEKYGAGNCDMAGSMAYTLMRAALTADYEVMLIVNQKYHHTYAAFNEVGGALSDAIIVDPWPTSGMATLAEHHFQGFEDNPSILRKRGKWDGVSAVQDRVALNKRYATLADNIDRDLAEINQGRIALPNHNFTPFGNQLCSAVVGNYLDSDSKPIPLPPERPLLPPPPIPEADAQAVAVNSEGDVIMRDACELLHCRPGASARK